MSFINAYVTTNTIVYFYMFTYNLTLIGFFWIFLSVLNKPLKTLYSFNMFGFDSFFIFVLTIFLFSFAGVPPFLGFFSKIFIFDLLLKNNFFIFYFLFFIILILGLYFYMQNLRFIHSTNPSVITKHFVTNVRVVVPSYYYIVLLTIFVINGIYLLDELLPLFSWILN